MEGLRHITGEEFKMVGSTLFSKPYKQGLSDYLKVDYRRILDWRYGNRPIPVGIPSELLEHAYKIKSDLLAIELELKEVLENSNGDLHNLKSAQLESIGMGLYGEMYKTPLCRKLGIKKGTLIEWLKEERAIPIGVVRDLQVFIESRVAAVNAAIDLLESI